MARVKIVEEGEEDAEDKRQAEELVALNAAEGGDLFNAIDELRGAANVVCIVTRTAPQGKTGYAGQMSVSEFSREKIRSVYGAGRYRVQIKGPKGFLPGGGSIEIAETAEKPSGGGTDIAAILEAMNKSQADNRERNNRLLELAIPGALGIIAAMVGKNQGTDIAALVAALKPAPGPTLNDLAQTLSSMKALTADTSPRDPLETIFNIMEKVKGLSGSGEQGESNWTDVVRDLVKEAIPAVKPMLDNIAANQQKQIQQQQQQPPFTIQPLPAIHTAPVVHQPETIVKSNETETIEKPKEGEDMFAMFAPTIKEHLAKIVKWATDDRNPQAYAEVFLDELPQIVANYIKPDEAIGYLNRSDWWEKVREYYPALNPHYEWCSEFRDELLSLINEQIEEIKEVHDKADREENQSDEAE